MNYLEVELIYVYNYIYIQSLLHNTENVYFQFILID